MAPIGTVLMRWVKGDDHIAIIKAVPAEDLGEVYVECSDPHLQDLAWLERHDRVSAMDSQGFRELVGDVATWAESHGYRPTHPRASDP